MSIGVDPEWMWNHLHERVIDWARIQDPKPLPIATGLKRLVGALLTHLPSPSAGAELVEKVGEHVLGGFNHPGQSCL
jgi:hypothetical protein